MKPTNEIAAAPPRGIPFLTSHAVGGASSAASSSAMSTGSTTLEIFDSSHRATPTATRTMSDRHDQDRKSTRLNSSHVAISYAVFCLKKKKQARNQLAGAEQNTG